jgi:O-antigen/teichoic acid export membrane protein
METTFFRYVKDSNEPRKVYSTILWSLLATTIFTGALLFFFSQNIADVLQYPNNVNYVRWFILILAFDALAAVPFAKLRYDNRPLKFATIKLLNIFLTIALVLFFLVACPYFIETYTWLNLVYDPNIGVGYVFIANLVASACTLLLLVGELLEIERHFDSNLYKKMIAYALPLAVAGFAGRINELLDRVLLKFLLPFDLETNMAHLGVYGACYKLSILMTLFTQAFWFAAEPFFFAQSNDKASNPRQTYAFTLKYFVIVGTFIFIGVMLFLDIFKHLIGSSFHSGLVVVPILLMANLFLGIYYNLSIWYKLNNQTHLGAYISGVGAIVTIILNVALIPSIGYVGSAWATLVCYMCMVMLSYYWCQKHYPIPYNVSRISLYLAAATGIVLFDQYILLNIPNTLALYTCRIGLIMAYTTMVYLLEVQKTWHVTK